MWVQSTKFGQPIIKDAMKTWGPKDEVVSNKETLKIYIDKMADIHDTVANT